MSPLWRGIHKTCILDERVWNIFSSNCRVIVFSGRQTAFWTDIWIGGVAISVTFPALFRLAVDKQISVNAFVKFLRGDSSDLGLAITGMWRRSLRVAERDAL